MKEAFNRTIAGALFAAVAVLSVSVTLDGCASFEGGLDSRGLGQSAAAMLEAVHRYQGGRLGGPDALARMVADYDPFSSMEPKAPAGVVTTPLDRWNLEEKPAMAFSRPTPRSIWRPLPRCSASWRAG